MGHRRVLKRFITPGDVSLIEPLARLSSSYQLYRITGDDAVQIVFIFVAGRILRHASVLPIKSIFVFARLEGH